MSALEVGALVRVDAAAYSSWDGRTGTVVAVDERDGAEVYSIDLGDGLEPLWFASFELRPPVVDVVPVVCRCDVRAVAVGDLEVALDPSCTSCGRTFPAPDRSSSTAGLASYTDPRARATRAPAEPAAVREHR